MEIFRSAFVELVLAPFTFSSETTLLFDEVLSPKATASMFENGVIMG
jgi:hypothetical protein